MVNQCMWKHFEATLHKQRFAFDDRMPGNGQAVLAEVE
jgi:hypothetical protein